LRVSSAATEDAAACDGTQLKFSGVISVEDHELLACYHHGFDDEKVDIDLIVCLLYKIHTEQQEGSGIDVYCCDQ
jgi:hypothetical protein